MMPNPDDEAAFPFEFDHRDEADGPIERMSHPGMSLRDYFAAQALIAISGRWRGTVSDIDKSGGQLSAKIAYRLADAMLEARKR
jgi:hypothetical protein